MAKPKFSRGQVVVVPHQDAKPHLFSGVGVVTNLLRLNRSWRYDITFDSGRKEEVEEVRIETR